VTINTNGTLRIWSYGLDQGYFVRSVKINELNWSKNWLEHNDVMAKGSLIEFFVVSGPAM
jgi:hypothetical protein